MLETLKNPTIEKLLLENILQRISFTIPENLLQRASKYLLWEDRDAAIISKELKGIEGKQLVKMVLEAEEKVREVLR